jgi:formate hydrogenlyase transcriptional activator
MDGLKKYPWPGNIRELQNFIERAVILTRGGVLELPPLPSVTLTKKEPVTLREAERHHLLKTLEATNWVVGGPFGAAVRLGTPRTTLMAKMQKHGIFVRPRCLIGGRALSVRDIKRELNENDDRAT